jgi:stress response protein YsnF
MEVDVAPEPRQEGDTWIIPVIEEVLVVEKRLVVKEEIRLTRHRVTSQIPVSDTVRRQVVEIETESASGERRAVELGTDTGNESAGTSQSTAGRGD